MVYREGWDLVGASLDEGLRFVEDSIEGFAI